MVIGGFQKLTLIDFPGKLAAIIFTGGCSFSCPFCYNSDLVSPASGAPRVKISQKSVFEFLKERMGLLEGVVITGGEPTINKELPGLIKKIKKLNYSVKLDTNGSNPKMLEDLIDKELLDYVAMDIKAPRERYSEAAGTKVDIEKIQKSINILKEGKVDYEFRTTIVPYMHKREDLIEMAKWIRGAKRYYLQNFRPGKTINPDFGNIKPYSLEYLLDVQKAISPFFETCFVR